MRFSIASPNNVNNSDIIESFLLKYPNYSRAECYTTKPGTHSKEYIFKDRNDFLSMADDMIIKDDYLGNLYGISSNNLKNQDVVFNVNVKNALELKKKYNIHSILILPSLYFDHEQKINMEQKIELSFFNNFDYILRKDQIESTLEIIKYILLINQERETIMSYIKNLEG